MVHTAQEVCGLPTILAHPWFERLVAGRPARLVERGVFVEWWASRGLVSAPASKRLWEVLRPEGRNHLTYDDFKPLLQVRGEARWGRGFGYSVTVLLSGPSSNGASAGGKAGRALVVDFEVRWTEACSCDRRGAAGGGGDAAGRAIVPEVR